LKDGLRNGGSVDLLRLSALGSVWPDGYRLIQKARGGFSGAGFSLATMKICR
jgi:hypothetical protein